jgi:hypothetical protein
MAYKSQFVSVIEMLDELMRNGRTAHDAGRELRHAIIEGAIPIPDHFALSKVSCDVVRLSSAYAGALRGERVSPGEMSWLQYLNNVHASRTHFERACKLNSKSETADNSKLQPIGSGISAAIDDLYPFPIGQRASERNANIKQYLLDHRYSVPASDAALERAIQRRLRNRKGRK